MIDTGGLRRGLIIEMDGDLYRVGEYQHVKQGRGSAFVRLTLKNMKTGSTTTQTFQAGSKFNAVRLERQRAQYLYSDDNLHNFMDVDSFEQIALDSEALGDNLNYLTQDLVLELLMHDGQPVDIELPTTVDLKVTQTDPGMRGDTAAGGSKPAVVETGITITVPLFINEGDTIRVDTRSGEYVERVT